MRSYLVKWYFFEEVIDGIQTSQLAIWLYARRTLCHYDRKQEGKTCWYLLMVCKKLRAAFPSGNKLLRSLLVMNGIVLGGDPNRGGHIENVYFVNWKECWLGKWKNCRQFWRHTLEPRQNIIKILLCAGELINHFIVSINRNNLIDPHSRHFIMSMLE